jgi:hypothetical protein
VLPAKVRGRRITRSKPPTRASRSGQRTEAGHVEVGFASKRCLLRTSRPTRPSRECQSASDRHASACIAITPICSGPIDVPSTDAPKPGVPECVGPTRRRQLSSRRCVRRFHRRFIDRRAEIDAGTPSGNFPHLDRCRPKGRDRRWRIDSLSRSRPQDYDACNEQTAIN